MCHCIELLVQSNLYEGSLKISHFGQVATFIKRLAFLSRNLMYVLVFPGKEVVVNCQSELPKLSESYNCHLLKPVKLTMVACLKLVKGHRRKFFHLSAVKESD